MADGWVVQETAGVLNNEPVMLKVNFDVRTTSGVYVIGKNVFNQK